MLVGVFNKAQEGVGTYFKERLTDMLAQQNGDGLAAKLTNLRGALAQGISSPSGDYNVALETDDVISWLEATFDYQGNSGGYNAKFLDLVRKDLISREYVESRGEGRVSLRREKGNVKTEVWFEADKVGIRIEGDSLYDEKVFKNCLALFEERFNHSIGKRLAYHYSSPEEFYKALGKGITAEWYKTREDIVIQYQEEEIKINVARTDGDSQVRARMMVHLTPEQVSQYKGLTIEKRFDDVRGAVAFNFFKLSKGESRDIMRLTHIVERTISAYDELRKRIPKNTT